MPSKDVATMTPEEVRKHSEFVRDGILRELERCIADSDSPFIFICAKGNQWGTYGRVSQRELRDMFISIVGQKPETDDFEGNPIQ